MRQHTIPRKYTLTLLRLKSEQQIALAEEVMEKSLTMQETREKVMSILGKELKWRLIPIRIEPRVYDQLVQIASDRDVSKLLN